MKKIKLRDMTMDQFKEWVNRMCYYSKLDCKDCIFGNKVDCTFRKTSWVNNKDKLSNKFLDQEIEVQEDD